MSTIDKVYSGVPARLSFTIDSDVTGEFLPDIPVMARPLGLRSTIVSGNFETVAGVMAMVAEDWQSSRSPYTHHTGDCAAHEWLDESDCNCIF